jgi:hypothetical protein
MGRLAGTLALNPVLGHSHAAYMIIRGIEQVAKGQDVFKSTKKTTLNSIFNMPMELRKDTELAFNIQLGLYQKYLRATEAVAHEYNVKSAYFLQPAPAYGKTLTEEEKRNAGDLGYGDLYRKVAAGMMTLREHGLPIYDLADIFASEKGTIYADHIHYLRDANEESRGNRLMANRIGELLAETWGLKRKP